MISWYTRTPYNKLFSLKVSDMSGDMDGWTVILLDDAAGFTLFPTATDGWLEYRSYPARDQNVLDRDRSTRDEVIYYWQAPIKYYGNRVRHNICMSGIQIIQVVKLPFESLLSCRLFYSILSHNLGRSSGHHR